jgi:chromosome segregation ATPase
MKRNLLRATLFCLLLISASFGQSGPSSTASPNPGGSAQTGRPVSYASVSQLNGLLAQLETTSKTAQTDLSKLRIERWKADGSYKKQALGNVDSIQRNLQGALPEIIGQLRSAPEDLPATFKLYRNLDALYDVLGSVVEGAGAFGSKDDLQSLSNDLSSFEGTRKQLAERIESLSASKETEINNLRTQLKSAEAQIAATPPKKVVVDDTEPPKKPATKKKSTAKKPTKPDAGQPSQQPAATKPQ